MIECISGWGKQHGTMRKTKHRSTARVVANSILNLIAYNLIPIPKLGVAWQPGVRLRPQNHPIEQRAAREIKPKVFKFFSKLLELTLYRQVQIQKTDEGGERLGGSYVGSNSA